MEKHAYAMVKTLNSFMCYVLHSQIVAYVPHNTMKDILCQTKREGRKGEWISKIQEYRLEIKPTELVKGRWIDNLLGESKCQALDLNLIP